MLPFEINDALSLQADLAAPPVFRGDLMRSADTDFIFSFSGVSKTGSSSLALAVKHIIFWSNTSYELKCELSISSCSIIDNILKSIEESYNPYIFLDLTARSVLKLELILLTFCFGALIVICFLTLFSGFF